MNLPQTYLDAADFWHSAASRTPHKWLAIDTALTNSRFHLMVQILFQRDKARYFGNGRDRGSQDPNEASHDDLGGLYGHLLPLIPPGLNYSFFTREMGYPEPIFAWRSKFHDFLYKVNPQFPCRTIKAQPGKFTGPFHWKNRHFTIHELKRLQEASQTIMIIVGNYGRIVEQIGNSVPPTLAFVIGTTVREQLVDQCREFTFERRPNDFVPTFRQRQRERTFHFKDVAREAMARATIWKAKSSRSNESI